MRLTCRRTPRSWRSLGELAAGYIEVQNTYRAAIREINTKLEILDDEFRMRHQRNPIHYMQSRLKTPRSIMEKLRRKGLPFTPESVRENLTDVAGIRVICHYIDDIYMVAKLLTAQDDITLVRETDYIKNPKPNGYRSLHLVVQVPVEIQIRTVAMDFWASLEHELRYKAAEDVPDYLVKELTECAEIINRTDMKMQWIYKALGEIKDVGKKN